MGREGQKQLIFGRCKSILGTTTRDINVESPTQPDAAVRRMKMSEWPAITIFEALLSLSLFRHGVDLPKHGR
jgi:hypothetical protein